MPPLNTALIEVHLELAKTIRATREMVEVCKRMTKAADLIHMQWLVAKKNNEDLSIRLQVEAQLKEEDEHLQHCDYAGIPHVLDKEFWDQL